VQLEDIKAWNCTRCKLEPVSDFSIEEVIHVDNADLTAFVGMWPRLDSVVVAFRGTDSHNLGNWIADMDVLETQYYHIPHISGASL
jgi:hypothetical protein